MSALPEVENPSCLKEDSPLLPGGIPTLSRGLSYLGITHEAAVGPQLPSPSLRKSRSHGAAQPKRKKSGQQWRKRKVLSQHEKRESGTQIPMEIKVFMAWVKKLALGSSSSGLSLS